ncbi:phosphoadenosine phosphosulfate reductase [Alkalilacustris brevis]|uniref:phosphoadenosine phosphosulfate reductase n=1 Tax=Alkalilacustris brevis TaxID=2026338 RepID=UPI000E0DF5C8|nr:phosphoadenosine phosphosulfate reductase [Alkalilacustris brevis]
MQQDTSFLDATGATDFDEWLARIDEIGEELGYFQRLGKDHAAFFSDDSQTTLLVTFETAEAIRTGQPGQMPQGLGLARGKGWSHLCLVAFHDSWYRDPAVWGYFDRLVDDAFFEDFDRVVFYGEGMCGYAAAAFSVAAPGATVVTLHPRATLDPRIAEWDNRFARHRRLDFTSRYGFAPDMIDGAAQVFVLYDPERGLDAMHAALFARPHVTRLRCRHLGGRLEQDLLRMNILPELLIAAGEGRLDAALFHRLFRARRDYLPYLLRLLSRLEARERHGLTALLARWALQHKKHPRLRRARDKAENALHG